jgi:hypothetical protein
MAASYPGAIVSGAALPSTIADGTSQATVHAQYHNQAHDEIKAIEAELGILPKGTDASVRARLDKINPASPSAYTVTNTTTDRTIDANSTTIAELLNVVGTLIADLKTRGIVG